MLLVEIIGTSIKVASWEPISYIRNPTRSELHADLYPRSTDDRIPSAHLPKARHSMQVFERQPHQLNRLIFTCFGQDLQGRWIHAGHLILSFVNNRYCDISGCLLSSTHAWIICIPVIRVTFLLTCELQVKFDYKGGRWPLGKRTTKQILLCEVAEVS